MPPSRRSFLRAAVVAPVVTGAWVVYEWRTGKLKVRQQPVACCVPNGTPGQSCPHPAPAKNGKPA